jgi:putative transposase
MLSLRLLRTKGEQGDLPQRFTVPAELMEQVAEQGLEILPELIRIVINAAMQAERSEHLQAGPYQHTEERRGYANGFKPKTMRTRVFPV